MPRIRISCIVICTSLGISPVTAETNHSVVPGSTLTATTTKASTGHRPTPPYSEIRVITNNNYPLSSAGGKAIFPGWRTEKGAFQVHYDPDVRSYGGKESYISQCSFFFIDRKNNAANDLTVIKKPCEASDFSMTIERKHVGHKIRLIMVNETDPNSVTGYTPVPLASLEGRAFETGYILDTPSPSNSTVSIDKNPLSPGETATVTMVLRDINNTPLELTHDLPYGDVFPGWSLTEAKPTGQPGEYKASVTYTGGQNSSPVYRPEWKYYGETLHPAITLNGIP